MALTFAASLHCDHKPCAVTNTATSIGYGITAAGAVKDAETQARAAGWRNRYGKWTCNYCRLAKKEKQ